MKTKLLKKIRKRFSYAKKENGYYILIDHKKQNIIILCKSTLEDLGYDNIEIEYTELSFRILKRELLKPFISNGLDKIMYRTACILNGIKPRKTSL